MIRGRAENVSITEARARLPELVRRAKAGEEIVITRRGKPVARLLPPPVRACLLPRIGTSSAVDGPTI
ncbi:type II toxin-antitoxin system prevent-host-death family antitoxin [Mesorhizobium sp. WSM4308]|uniref:type II toxin-antitoxin system Phd/YefM family antitoxin n=1 Tax=unclassified Mesorhizobium TaxID=325217 RepID=UPI0032AF1186